MVHVPIIGFWHICMLNHWKEIIKEQYQLISQSGLIDVCDKIYIGALGSEEELRKLKEFIRNKPKLMIDNFALNVREYEFPTLNVLRKRSIAQKFYGFYIHTKGISWPGHEGGTYWRDYMNYYTITRWRDARNKLINGYDLCGVKLRLNTDPPARKLHYSGNFFWFKSDYTKNLPIARLVHDRFDAEMWVGQLNPKAATLCQMFVDYNTKGKFHAENKNYRIYLHTLCYNLPSEVEKTVRLIYEQNESRHFIHYLIDLGFPIDKGTEIPDSIKKAKEINEKRLMEIACRYGSIFLKMPNIGVSQNWTQVINHINPGDNDVVIGVDPDERTMSYGWVNAMAEALQEKKIGMVTLMMPEQAKELSKWPITEYKLNGFRAVILNGTANWALIGFKGEFLKKMGDMPYPETHPRYGYIESFVRKKLDELGYKYLFLPEFQVYHTDYPRDEGSPKLLREWKNQIIFNYKEYGQIDFEEFLKMKRDGKFPDKHTLKYKTC
jgi:hypothetical protein